MSDSVILEASNKAFNDLFFHNHLWTFFAYKTYNYIKKTDIWRVKCIGVSYSFTKRISKILKCIDKNGYVHYVDFDFGNHDCIHQFGKYKGIWISCELEFKRAMLEEMCRLSDEGYEIVVDDLVILDRYQGAKTLIDIDLNADYEQAYQHELPFQKCKI